MNIWIINPFDNLPVEGYRPQRYWLMSEAFARAGHDVTFWTQAWSHARKRARELAALGEGEHGQLFALELVPYFRDRHFPLAMKLRAWKIVFSKAVKKLLRGGRTKHGGFSSKG